MLQTTNQLGDSPPFFWGYDGLIWIVICIQLSIFWMCHGEIRTLSLKHYERWHLLAD